MALDVLGGHALPLEVPGGESWERQKPLKVLKIPHEHSACFFFSFFFTFFLFFFFEAKYMGTNYEIYMLVSARLMHVCFAEYLA